MLISKLPHPTKPREFLTKPSSWAKLIVGFGIVGLMVWFNVKPNRKSITAKGGIPQSENIINGGTIENPQSNSGQVAGAQDNRIDNSELIIPDEEKDSQAKQKTVEFEGLPQVEFPIPKDTNSELNKTILASDDIKLLFKTGSDALDNNDLDLAQLSYIRITQIAPEYKDAWYFLGYTYLKKFERDPVIKYADPAPTNLNWAIVALNRAHLIAPQSDPITQLLNNAQEIDKDG